MTRLRVNPASDVPPIILTRGFQVDIGPTCDTHFGWPVHMASECGRLDGVEPGYPFYFCDVCGFKWTPWHRREHGTAMQKGVETRYLRRGGQWVRLVNQCGGAS